MKVILNKVPVKTIFAISNGDSVSAVGRKVQSQLATMTIIVNKFERAGLITSVKIGRIRKLTLTKMGEKVKSHLKYLK